ncbi:MAG: general secretion pathway protein GspF [Gammaproteobacteria bacterium]|jgi:hypothetical protein
MSGRPRTPEAYASLVDQAIFELVDILEAARFENEEIEVYLGYVDTLLRELRELRASMADGSYRFGRADLPFMRIVKKHTANDLPCIRLFYQINRTHREGLDIEAD